MAKNTDKAGIQFRMLNRSKVRGVVPESSGGQGTLQSLHEEEHGVQKNLSIKQATMRKLLWKTGRSKGLTTLGTFMGQKHSS